MNEEQLREKISLFESHWKINPVDFEDDDLIVLKIFTIQRSASIFQAGERNTKDRTIQRTDYFACAIIPKKSLNSINKYISFENFTIKKQLSEFAKLQNIHNKYFSLSPVVPLGYDLDDVTVIDIPKFDNYLQHLNNVSLIKTKTSKIVRDKFNVLGSTDIDTSAIFANVGYIVKNFEGKYISLSKGDRTFIKNFMDDLIKDGAYKITVR